ICQFFFSSRRRHTRWPRDWSSDVCSSDLAAGAERLYAGFLSKPGRMVLLALFAVAAFVLGPVAWGPFGPLLLAGTALTVVERIRSEERRVGKEWRSRWCA